MNSKTILLDYCNKLSQQKEISTFDKILLSLSSRIPNDFNDAQDTTYYDYDGLKRLNAEGNLMHAFSDDLYIDSTPDEKNFFVIQFKLRQQNIWNMRDRLFDPSQTSLEIGCGILDNGGFSFLTSSIPRAVAKNFSYSEVNPNAIQKSLRNFPEAKIQFADVVELDHYYPPQSFDNIVGINVLDTLDAVDLIKSLEQIQRVLKPGGQLIHILNMEPFFCSIYHTYFKDDVLAFPYLQNDSARKIILLPKEAWKEMRKDLENKKLLPEIAIAFLDYVSTLSGLQQERLWVGMNTLDKNASMAPIAKALIALGNKAIPSVDLFKDQYQKSLQECGFTEPENWDETSSTQLKVSEEHLWGGLSVECSPQGVLRIPTPDLSKEVVDIAISTSFFTARTGS